MEDEMQVTRQPGHDIGMLVGGVIVENNMDYLAGWRLRFDGIQKADEFLVGGVAAYIAH